MPTERRQHQRHRVSLPVDVRFLAEEETFTPFQFDACVADMSVTGAMVTISDIAAEQYDVLFRRPRFLRMRCQFPSAGQPTVLFGRVVWHEFCPDTDPAFCRTAVAFEPLKKEDMGTLERFLEEAVEPVEDGPPVGKV